MNVEPCIARYAPYAAFACFGAFWGAWGAALPALRAQAALTDGQLGSALLCVGLGALPAMLLTGRALDRLGLRATSVWLGLLSLAGVLIGAGARDVTSTSVCMLIVGATSGAADVAINTLAGEAESRASRPILTRAHGVFSLAVVVVSLGVGGLMALGLGLGTAFALVAVVGGALAATVFAGTSSAPQRASVGATGAPSVDALVIAPLVVLGVVGALAYATENAHQSWGAVVLTDAYDASPQLAALAPATFAATAAVARLSVAPLSRSHPIILLVGGGVVATAGSVLLATASTVPVALLGLSVAALGTATLFPTLLSHSLRDVDPAARGRATSVMSTVAYLGFLLGPVYVGVLADRTDVRGAFLGVALLALVFTVAGAPVCRAVARRIVRTVSSAPSRAAGAAGPPASPPASRRVPRP